MTFDLILDRENLSMTNIVSTSYAVQHRNADDINGWTTFREGPELEPIKLVYAYWRRVNHTHNMQYRLVKFQVAEITEVLE